MITEIKIVGNMDDIRLPSTNRFRKVFLYSQEEADLAFQKGKRVMQIMETTDNHVSRVRYYVEVPFDKLIEAAQ